MELRKDFQDRAGRSGGQGKGKRHDEPGRVEMIASEREEEQTRFAGAS